MDELDDKADGFLRAQGLNPSTQDVADFLIKRPDVWLSRDLSELRNSCASRSSRELRMPATTGKIRKMRKRISTTASQFISELTSWQVEKINSLILHLSNDDCSPLASKLTRHRKASES